MTNDEEVLLYIIGVGNEQDWEAGRGSLYYIEDRNNERAMPTFTTPERAENFIEANFNKPEAHMQMLESISVLHAPALTGGRFIIRPVAHEQLDQAAARVEADYLVRDPRPGPNQEIMRLST